MSLKMSLRTPVKPVSILSSPGSQVAGASVSMSRKHGTSKESSGSSLELPVLPGEPLGTALDDEVALDVANNISVEVYLDLENGAVEPLGTALDDEVALDVANNFSVEVDLDLENGAVDNNSIEVDAKNQVTNPTTRPTVTSKNMSSFLILIVSSSW
jgi:hypothetical protein